MTELLVRVVLSNPRTNESRDWLWDAEVFADRVGYMRTAWQDWMLKSIACPMHTTSDPFWSAPRTQHVGDAYMYLARVPAANGERDASRTENANCSECDASQHATNFQRRLKSNKP